MPEILVWLDSVTGGRTHLVLFLMAAAVYVAGLGSFFEREREK